MLISVVVFAILFAIMAAWRLVAIHTFYDYGIAASLALMAGTVGLAFWIDHKWPQPRHDPPGTSAETARKLDMVSHVDTAVVLGLLVVFFAALLTVPTDWLWYWLIPFAVVYVRWAVVCMRHEERLKTNGVSAQTSGSDPLRKDHDRLVASGSDTLPPPSIQAKAASKH
jgi:hypothetical protein